MISPGLETETGSRGIARLRALGSLTGVGKLTSIEMIPICSSLIMSVHYSPHFDQHTIVNILISVSLIEHYDETIICILRL